MDYPKYLNLNRRSLRSNNDNIVNREQLSNASIIGPVFTMFPTDAITKVKLSPNENEKKAISTTLRDQGITKATDSKDLLLTQRKENWYQILAQVFGPFTIAGFGMLCAGLLLNQVKEWKVFKEIPEFLILVTPLLGLKGNLEMTLSSRLGTHANLGHMDLNHTKYHIAFGNLALTQVQIQVIIVGCLASVVAISISAFFNGRFVFENSVLLTAASILTAAVASCFLGIFMVSVIFLSKRFKINPDNISTPIASLGDVITLFLLAWLGSMLFEETDDKPNLAPMIILGYFFFTPLWGWISYSNEYTRNILKCGWLPVLISMLISSAGGYILGLANSYPNLALYQPLINGVGGNLVAVQASRISTSLHRDKKIGQLPTSICGAKSSVWMSPFNVFFKQGINSTAAVVLTTIVIPGHLMFTTVIHFISGINETFSPMFLTFYLGAALIQVILLLYIAQIMINWLWTKKIDPDHSAIPYLTSLGDLIGSALLALAFYFFYMFSNRSG